MRCDEHFNFASQTRNLSVYFGIRNVNSEFYCNFQVLHHSKNHDQVVSILKIVKEEEKHSNESPKLKRLLTPRCQSWATTRVRRPSLAQGASTSLLQRCFTKGDGCIATLPLLEFQYLLNYVNSTFSSLMNVMLFERKTEISHMLVTPLSPHQLEPGT